MRLFGLDIRRASAPEQRAVQITQGATRDELLAYYGMDGVRLPTVSQHSALRVPAFVAAVTFLARTLATLELNAWKATDAGPAPITGRLGIIISEAPNPEWSSYQARVSFWQDVFSSRAGRGVMVIVRDNGQPVELWPVRADTVAVTIDQFGRKRYRISGRPDGALFKDYPASDVIDVPFMLQADMVNARGPLSLGEKALQLAIAMGDYGAQFFAGGGMPPLALKGPLPTGPEAQRRAIDDVHRAVDVARQSDKPITMLPSGYELSPIGFEPQKGQMTDARRFQVEEIARIFQLPPVFLQDLSRATFSNAEQQDLHLVKHVIGQWATALEQEMNLKLFGQMKNGRYVKHNIDSLLRGDFKTRMEGLAKAVQNSLMTPNEARELEGRQPLPDGDKLYMQGATVPIGSNANGDANGGSGNPDTQPAN